MRKNNKKPFRQNKNLNFNFNALKKHGICVCIITLIFFVAVSFYAAYLLKDIELYNYKDKTNNLLSKVINKYRSNPFRDQIIQTNLSEIQENPQNYIVNIYRILNGKKELVISKPPYTLNSGINILKWDNFLVYGEKDVYMYNLDTGESKKIISGEGVDLKEHDFINNLFILGDSLFVSYGSNGYEELGTYWVDLGSLPSPTKIASTLNARLKKYGGDYFLVGGWGDGCSGDARYMKLDPKKKTIIGAETFLYSCGDGYMALEVDESKRNIILAKYTTRGSESLENEEIEAIAAVPFDNLREKRILSNNMPKGIKSAVFDEKEKKIILSKNKQIYFMDANGGTPVFAGEFKEIQENTYLSWAEGGISCIAGGSNEQGVLIDVNKKTILDESSNCPGKEDIYKELVKFSERLDLPKNYEILLEENKDKK